MADLAEQIRTLSPGLQAGLAALLFVVFGVKAAVFPLYFWLPDSYPTAPTAVTAIFAGLFTKVGVYAIVRTQTLLFDADVRPTRLILIVAVLTMVVGVLRRHRTTGREADPVVPHRQPDRLHGAGARVVHAGGARCHGALRRAPHRGEDHALPRRWLDCPRRFDQPARRVSAGSVRTAPLVAVLFLLPALSLAGIPPFSGFVAKFAVLDASAKASEWVGFGAAIAVGFLTLFSMFKIWIGAFWGQPTEALDGSALPEAATPLDYPVRPIPALMVIPTAALGAAGLLIGLFAGPLYRLSERAALDLIDPSVYIRSVLGG